MGRFGVPCWCCSFAAVLAACGAPAPTQKLALETASVCPRISGDFAGTFTLTGSSGQCAGAKQTSYDTLHFDDLGRFESPATAVVTCTTDQSDCEVAVRCIWVGASAGFDGTLCSDGSTLVGTASLPGQSVGCSRLFYDLEATRVPDP